MLVGCIQTMGLATSLMTQRMVPQQWISVVEWIPKANRPFQPTGDPKNAMVEKKSTPVVKIVYASWIHTSYVS